MKKTNDLMADRLRTAISKTYFSGWIENFGVVPLFLSAAFLFLPIFLSLLALLFFVTRVLETIFQLLTQSIQLKRIIYLSLKMLIVKVLLLNPVYASEHSITMAIGQYSDISIRNLRNFSIGNKDIINASYDSNSKKLFLKAKKLGYSELLLTHQDNLEKRYSVYVIDKRSQLNLRQKMSSLDENNINYIIQSGKIVINGPIGDLKKYQLIQNLFKDSQKNIKLEAKLDPKLRNSILFDIYQSLLEQSIEDVYCKEDNSNIQCQYFEDSAPSKDLFKHLSSKYFVKFIKSQSHFKKDNYEINLKLINIEKADGTEFSLGLDKLNTSLKLLFKEGLKSLIENNIVYFQENKINATTLAEPSLKVKHNSNSQFQIGSDLPFINSNDNGQTTDWKFAGVKIKVKVSSQGNRLFLNYENEVTSPNNNIISGNKGSSIVRFNLDEPLKLFEVGLHTENEDLKKIPLLGDIPILGIFFKKKKLQKTFRRLIAYVEIKRI